MSVIHSYSGTYSSISEYSASENVMRCDSEGAKWDAQMLINGFELHPLSRQSRHRIPFIIDINFRVKRYNLITYSGALQVQPNLLQRFRPSTDPVGSSELLGNHHRIVYEA